jgi:4-methyl-5(b-hydroxyethyl)-thiazole monophosphate biosynthesis
MTMVYMLLGTGFEETEAVAPLDLLRRAGVTVLTVGLNGKTVYGSHSIGIEADITLPEMDLTQLEMIILPGGLGGVASIRACEGAMNALRFAWENNKFVAAICAGPTVLADLGITDGKNATCYPGCESGMGHAHMIPDAPCIRDGKLITGTSAGCAIPFGLMLVAALKGEEAAQNIRDQIVIR